MRKGLRPDLSLTVIFALAALAAPRVIMHDLRLVPFDSPLYRLFAVGPLLVWLLVAVLHRTKKPWQDFIMLGLVFGLLLGAIHQITWVASWDNNLPQLHGNLEGKLDPAVEGLILRTAAYISSIMTGLFTGVILGGIAWIANKLRK